MKFWAYAGLNAVSAVVLIAFHQPLGILCIVLAAYFARRALADRAPAPPSTRIAVQAALGTLGMHYIDGEDEEPAYGLYVLVLGHHVFVDVKQDEYLAERCERATGLFEATRHLEQSLLRFLERNPSYRSKVPAILGLHAPDIDRIEVFWEPSGVTTLHGFEFDDP